MATYSGGGDPDRRGVVLRGHRDERLISIRKAVDSAVQRRRFVVTSAGPTSSSAVAEKVVLQKDFTVVTAPVRSSEVAVTRDSDGRMRFLLDVGTVYNDPKLWDCDGGLGDWSNSVGGAGAVATVTTTDHVGGSLHVVGEWGIGTGTTATGRGAFYKPPFVGFGDGTTYEFEARVTNGALSTVAEEFQLTVGFGDTFNAAGLPVDGACFIYRRLTDGDFWVCVTRSNSVETKTVTAVAPAGYSAMTILTIVVNDTGTSVLFYIDGVLVGTHASNIPTGASRLTGMGMKLEKTAGTTARFAYVDYFFLRKTRTAAR